MVAGMSKDFGDESITAAGASTLGCRTPGLCTGGVAVVVIETGLTGASSTITAATGAVEAALAAETAVATGVTATVAVVAAAEALEAAEEAEAARFFFFPASFFNAASAMACGNFGGGF